MLNIWLSAGGVVNVVDLAWEVVDGWLGFHIPGLTLTIPGLLRNGCMCVDGQ